MITIPVFPSIPLYTLSVVLDGTEYAFRFNWHARDSRWYFNIDTADGVPIRHGVKLICNVPLLRECAETLRPPGVLTCSDGTVEGLPPLFDDLGVRCFLYYQPVTNADGTSNGLASGSVHG